MHRRTFLSGAAAAVPLAAAADSPASPRRIQQLAQKPPLGWNSFDAYGVYLHEEAALANIEAMATKLRPFGYEYFVVDNGWFGEYKLQPGTRYAAEKHASDVRINGFGLLQPSKTYFPAGMQRIIDRAHARGLKFGLHLMRGIPRKAVELNLPVQGTRYTAREVANTSSVCAWCKYNYGINMQHPGGQAFYNSLVNQLARWGVDLIKADDLVPYPDEIVGIANAIERCGRDIVFSLSPGGSVRMTDLPYFRRANMLRVTADIWDRRSDLDKAFEAWRAWQGRQYPGFWIDLDMIPFGQLLLMSPPDSGDTGAVKLAGYGSRRWSQLAKDEMRTFVTQRALAASPLMIGGDLPTLDADSLELLTNREMLACNQNGVMGALVWEKDGIEVWHAAARDAVGSGWLGIFNRAESKKSAALGAREFGLETGRRYHLEDIWMGGRSALEDRELNWDLPGGGVRFLGYRRA